MITLTYDSFAGTRTRTFINLKTAIAWAIEQGFLRTGSTHVAA